MEPLLTLRHKKIYVAGHAGLVGAALCRRLAAEDCVVLTAPRAVLDLRDAAAVGAWFARHKPDIVIMAAARVGGIAANAALPVDFLHDNLAMTVNVIHAAHVHDVEKLLFLGSSCIYPRDAAQPIREEALLSGPLEPTNEAYALAKIAGVKLCESYRRQYKRDFITAMPCNLYGPGDRYDAAGSHVIPALLLKMREAARSGADSVTLWGTGRALREFMYVDDLADALVFLLRHYNGEGPINVGSGAEISIAALAQAIAAVTGFTGRIDFDSLHPDGTPRKIMDSSRLRALGWDRAPLPLAEGLVRAYADFTGRARDAA